MKGNEFMFRKILSTFALTGLLLTLAVSYFSISHRIHGFPITYRVHDYVVEIYGGHIHWYPRITDTPNLRRHQLALWIPALPFIVLFYFAHRPVYRNHRRRILGLCLHCGYDLRASRERCPECGVEVLLMFEKRTKRGAAGFSPRETTSGADVPVSRRKALYLSNQVPTGAFVAPRMRVPQEKLREPDRIVVEEATAGR